MKPGSTIDLNAAALLRQWGRGVRRGLILISGMHAAEALLIAAFYALFAAAAAPVVLRQDLSSLHLIYFALLCIGIRLIVGIIRSHVTAKLGQNIEIRIREYLLQRVTAQNQLHVRAGLNLVPLLTDAADEIVPYFTQYLSTVRAAMLIPAIILAAILSASPLAAMVLALIAPLIPVFMILIGRGAEKLNARQWKQIERLSGRFREAMQKISIVLAFNLKEREIKTIGRMTSRWRRETMQVLKLAFLSALAMEFFATAGVAFCAILMGFAVYESGFDYKKALLVLTCAPEFFIPLRALGQHYHTRMKALGALTLLKGLSPVPEVQRVRADCIMPRRFIEFKQAGAHYPDGRLGLKPSSFKLKMGAINALTGPSGSGKSTALLMLAGLLKPDTGTIESDVGVLDCTAPAWQKQLILSTQAAQIFAGTLRDNLKLVDPEASDQRLIQALQDAGADFLLQRWPCGLDQVIGGDQALLSGGEAHALAAARMILSKAKIWLLDEPTASLDPELEALIIDKLRIMAKGRTVIMCAHRPELIQAADEVIEFGS